MKKLCLLFLLVSLLVFGATAVTLAPVPQLQFFDAAGRPLAFGCVFSYNSGTTTPLATYTDFTGVTSNPNPVILNAGGSANIWLQAGQAYTIKVVSAGGSNCVSGTTRYTVNGIGGGASQVSTNVTTTTTPQFNVIAQNQLFLFTLTGNAVSLPLVVNNVQAPSLITFQIKQDPTGNWTFAWPANVNGGALIGTTPGQVTTQSFIWNGATASAIGPGIATQVGAANNPEVQVGILEASGDIFGFGDLNLTGIAKLAGGIQMGASQIATAFQGSGGTKIATASGSYANGDLICSNGTFDLISCGFNQSPSGAITGPLNTSIALNAQGQSAGAGTNIAITAANGTTFGGGNVSLTPGVKGASSTNGSVIVNHGMNGGTGFQHARIASCTTAAAAGATCDTTANFNGAAFDNVNYTAVCTISGGAGAVTGVPYVLYTSNKLFSPNVQFTVTIAALTASAASGTLDCIAVHD